MIDTVGVIGLGTMGAGIAEVFAKAGIAVTGVEIDAAALERGEANLAKSLDRQVKRGKLTVEARDEIAGRVAFSSDFASLSDAELVVEAVPERMEIKRELFSRLDEVCAPGAILASNTSSLSLTDIAGITKRPAQVIGMHFFNPAPVMKLVEVITTEHTDPAVTSAVEVLAARCGKTTVTVADRPGFVVNRLLVGYLNQAAKLMGSGRAGRDEIDAAMRTTGLPMGPLMLMDIVGLDTCVEILDVIHADSGSPRHEAAQILRDLVAAGKFGRKTGQGFYDHSAPADELPLEPDRAAALVAELVPPHVGEGQEMADSGYASTTDIDTGMKLGCGYPNGLFGLLPK